jgi:hypothetical protein
MKKASEILFNTSFNGKVLFKNQTELVQELLTNPRSEYYIDPTSTAEYLSKAQGRLKTYISQLLSDSVVRNISEDLKQSFISILSDKLREEVKEQVLEELFQAIQMKNQSLISASLQESPSTNNKGILQDEIHNANYVTVITARPIDMDLSDSDEGFSIRNFFLQDLIRSLTQEIDKLKFYRFNFPSETYCQLFWKGLEKILFRLLANKTYEQNLESIYKNTFAITTETFSKYIHYIGEREKNSIEPEILIKLGNNLRKTIAKEIVERLNRNRVIMTFVLDEPVFTLPLIVVNPNESTCSVHILVDSDDKRNIPLKFTPENTLLWRIFVWDKIKAKNSGRSIEYHIDQVYK